MEKNKKDKSEKDDAKGRRGSSGKNSGSSMDNRSGRSSSSEYREGDTGSRRLTSDEYDSNSNSYGVDYGYQGEMLNEERFNDYGNDRFDRNSRGHGRTNSQDDMWGGRSGESRNYRGGSYQGGYNQGGYPQQDDRNRMYDDRNDYSSNRNMENDFQYGEGRGQFERSSGNRGTQSHQGRFGSISRRNGGGFENYNQSGGYGDARRNMGQEYDSGRDRENDRRGMRYNDNDNSDRRYQSRGYGNSFNCQNDRDRRDQSSSHGRYQQRDSGNWDSQQDNGRWNNEFSRQQNRHERENDRDRNDQGYDFLNQGYGNQGYGQGYGQIERYDSDYRERDYGRQRNRWDKSENDSEPGSSGDYNW